MLSIDCRVVSRNTAERAPFKDAPITKITEVELIVDYDAMTTGPLIKMQMDEALAQELRVGGQYTLTLHEKPT